MTGHSGLSSALNGEEQAEAYKLWLRGFDTQQIAEKMLVFEHAVYNALHDVREDLRELEDLAQKHGFRLVDKT